MVSSSVPLGPLFEEPLAPLYPKGGKRATRRRRAKRSRHRRGVIIFFAERKVKRLKRSARSGGAQNEAGQKEAKLLKLRHTYRTPDPTAA